MLCIRADGHVEWEPFCNGCEGVTERSAAPSIRAAGSVASNSCYSCVDVPLDFDLGPPAGSGKPLQKQAPSIDAAAFRLVTFNAPGIEGFSIPPLIRLDTFLVFLTTIILLM